MAGKLCPTCEKMAFFKTVKGRKCTNCGYDMILLANDGKGGRGQRCSNCGQLPAFNGRCRNCGAIYR